MDENGVVTAKGKGETDILVTTQDGSDITQKCKIEIWWSQPYSNNSIYSDGINDATIPKGFQVSLKDSMNKIADGLVVRNANDGNEFVWIPIDLISGGYAAKSWGIGNSPPEFGEYYTSDVTENTKIINDINTSVATYHGYYIGRCEAGTLTRRTSKEQELTPVVMKATNIDTPVYGYNYITWDQVMSLSNELYTREVNGVQSRLSNQRSWDTALKFIEQVDSSFPTNSVNKGWYSNNSSHNPNYEIGKSIDLTGNTIPNMLKNIYDMAGNMMEWNAEKYLKNTTIRPPRGGSQVDTGTSMPASFRGGAFYTNQPNRDTGMRIIIYL